MKTFLGIDIGGTKCATLLGIQDDDGKIVVTDRIEYATSGYPLPGQMLPVLKEGSENLFSRNKLVASDIISIGISCGGPLDSALGLVLSPPNLPGWDDVHITEFFSKAFDVPAYLQNDANAGALAEWMMGAGRGTKNMIFLTFGTGMGAGLILNDRLYSGTNDLGGEAGHIRLAPDGPVGYGKAGSFEGFCSGGGIALLARSVVSEKILAGTKVSFCSSIDKISEIDARMVFQAARANDTVAAQIVHTSAYYLGQGLSTLIDILNPECIVIGSIYVRNEDILKPLIEEVLTKEALSPALRVCTIKPAELGDNIGDFAALCVAVYQNKFRDI